MLSLSRDSTWETRTCSGTVSVRESQIRQGVFPSKSPFQVFQKGCEKREHCPTFLVGPTSFRPAGQQSRAGNSHLDFPPVTVMGTGTAASWGFLEGRKFCAGEQAQALPDKGRRNLSRASFRKVLHFPWNKFLLLLSETAHTTRARLRCSHTALCSFLWQ